jgi:hypothetical protein
MTEDTDRAARDQLAKQTETRAEQAEKMKARDNWHPTPTQEECDLAALGVPVDNKKDDGSGPDLYAQTRAMWPAKRPEAGGYTTR